jgi:L-threonylcarbamoyladenylate synthase
MQEDIRKALSVVRQGGIILYPTDTVWGIGCDATQAKAVERIYALKRRPEVRSMLALIDSEEYLSHYVEPVPAVAYDLIACTYTPLTIIYSGARNVAPNLIAEDGTLGIRVTREAFSQGLCQALRKPLVSTSANLSGGTTPACFSEIGGEILRGVDYIVRYRQEEKGRQRPSSILQLGENGTVKIIRP